MKILSTLMFCHQLSKNWKNYQC